MWVSLVGLSTPRTKQCEAKGSSGRPASAPQLKCVCLKSPIEDRNVQPSCPHLFIPVAFFYWHCSQRGGIILSHKMTSKQRQWNEDSRCSDWLIFTFFFKFLNNSYLCRGFTAFRRSRLSVWAEFVLSTNDILVSNQPSGFVMCLRF